MRKNYSIYIFTFCLILLNILIIFNCYKAKNKQDNYFRLHVVANSNSIDDQITKLNVSKKINNYISYLFDSNKTYSKNDTKNIIIENIDNILDIANSEIKMCNEDYSSYANIGKISYDKKYSAVIDMDKGVYDSVQIVLGNGKGENFWSIIFPYSYNAELTDSNDLDEKDIEIKSGIIENIKKVVKFFS